MEIKKVDFEKIKSTEIDFSFEDLDVNGDNVINKKDRDLTKNTEVFNMITRLLNSTDEEDNFNLIDDFDYNAMKSGNTSAQCLDGNCQFTVPTKTANENAAISNLNNLASTNNCPDGNCSIQAPSSTSSRVDNPDGTYTISSTNSNGQIVAITYSADGKKSSAKTTDKDGNEVSTTSYKYNEDGSYSATIKYSDKTRTAKYDSTGKVLSYTDKFKNGTTKTSKFKYNSDGSYSVTIKNKKTGSVTTVKYNKNKKKTSSVTKNKSGKTTKKLSYKYNSDGSYRVTEQKQSSLGKTKVKTTNYDADGNKIKTKSGQNTIASATANNYKDKLNQDGTTFVIFTGPNCGHCDNFHKTFKQVLPAVSDLANFVEINSKADGDTLLWSFLDKFKSNINQYPIIVKFVNGKATGVFHPEESNPGKLLTQIQNQCKT